MTNSHHYRARLQWQGNRGDGTQDYATYGRDFIARVEGKPALRGSADAAFRGDPALPNPEDMLLIALSSCHMLSYLALCARRRISVVAYTDGAEGTMQTDASGGGRFTNVTLHPRVVIADAAHLAAARDLHAAAHALCFIANSCNFPVEHEAQVSVAPSGDAAV